MLYYHSCYYRTTSSCCHVIYKEIKWLLIFIQFKFFCQGACRLKQKYNSSKQVSDTDWDTSTESSRPGTMGHLWIWSQFLGIPPSTKKSSIDHQKRWFEGQHPGEEKSGYTTHYKPLGEVTMKAIFTGVCSELVRYQVTGKPAKYKHDPLSKAVICKLLTSCLTSSTPRETRRPSAIRSSAQWCPLENGAKVMKKPEERVNLGLPYFCYNVDSSSFD